MVLAADVNEEFKERSRNDARRGESLANQPSARSHSWRGRETTRSRVDRGDDSACVGHLGHRFCLGARVSVCGKVIRRTPESLRYENKQMDNEPLLVYHPCLC